MFIRGIYMCVYIDYVIKLLEKKAKRSRVAEDEVYLRIYTRIYTYRYIYISG